MTLEVECGTKRLVAAAGRDETINYKIYYSKLVESRFDFVLTVCHSSGLSPSF
jgi:hypothetical protein